MVSNRLAFGAVAIACIAAAGGGGYLATRQNTVPTPASRGGQHAGAGCRCRARRRGRSAGAGNRSGRRRLAKTGGAGRHAGTAGGPYEAGS